jgi:membrane associated rhomboid family serine protease
MADHSKKKNVGTAFLWMLFFILLIWGIEIINFLLDHQLCTLGIYPRRTENLTGILLSPLLHYGFAHLIMNSVPLLILGSMVVMRGQRVFIFATLIIIVVSGSAIWIFGRPAYHVGSSGLIFGYFGFILGAGWYERSFLSLFTAVIAIGLYGSTLHTGLVPLNSYISWEGHLFGLMAGIFASRILRNK